MSSLRHVQPLGNLPHHGFSTLFSANQMLSKNFAQLLERRGRMAFVGLPVRSNMEQEYDPRAVASDLVRMIRTLG